MSRLKEILMTEYNKENNSSYDVDDARDQLTGYFEDVAFNMESIEQLPFVPMNIKHKLARLRKDVNKIRFEIDKEL